MGKIKVLLIVTLVVLMVGAGGFFAVRYFLSGKPSGLLIDTTPDSSVYINGKLVGKTPYNGTIPSGLIDLKLTPDINDQSLIAYETKINLQPGIQTVVRREFGQSEDFSSGDVVSFEKTSNRSAGLIITSFPTDSQISIDSNTQGFTPHSSNSITPGLHRVSIASPGYLDRTIDVKAQSGYRLTVYVKLSKIKETPKVQNTDSLEASTKTYIVISDTPTGFLRMRTKPGVLGEEIAELTPGSKYVFLEEDQSSGWFKIQYKDPAPGLPEGITGWVSNNYTQMSTESGEINN
jgi:hypothetical protein